MKTVLSFIIFILTFEARGEILETRISKHIPSEGEGRPALYLFENGRVGRLSGDKSLMVTTELQEALNQQSWVKVELDSEGLIKEAIFIPEPQKDLSAEDPVPHFEAYRPTQLASYSEASSVFAHLNRRHQRDSQCYNRAHVWAYEEWRRIGLRSLKLFMFFTKRYIWEYKYDWWFHVTPMTYVGNTPYTLDRTFNRSPLLIKDWTLGFIKSRRDCPIVYKYSQYEQNQMTEHCYLIPATMYFWQPRDLESYEQTGRYKNDFVPAEVNHAYWEAF